MSLTMATQISAVQGNSPLGHRVFQQGEWRKAKFREHPVVTFKLGMDGGLSGILVKGIADTGAQANLWGFAEYIAAGFLERQLNNVTSRFCAADKRPIGIVGAFDGILEGKSRDGRKTMCRSMVYVSRSVTGFFLSFDTLLDMQVLDSSFPVIGAYPKNREVLGGIPYGQVCHSSDLCCQCPQRSAVPQKPRVLPFDPIPENIPKMKAWLLDRYGASSFNTCPHRPLQEMAGPPIEIHIDGSAKPKACHTAAPVPLHWQQKVREDLSRDEALGVIEKVPYGVPVVWCHRMVVTRKNDGTPRRTVDLSPLNKFCKRESFYSESPFLLARRVESKAWKSVTDAWNGFHSVPLRKSDRHLTTFITPFGRYLYNRAPQGFLSSGDGYNRRFDAILANFVRKERCVDDTIIYDKDLSAHWWRMIDFLSTVGSAGVVLNPEKFQFCAREVDFAGFRITDNTIEPLPKYFDAIKSFPTPRGITDVRSWFGLINQISSYAQVTKVMEPFRKFLSPKTKFYWDSKLENAFQEEIAE